LDPNDGSMTLRLAGSRHGVEIKYVDISAQLFTSAPTSAKQQQQAAVSWRNHYSEYSGL